MNIFKTKNTYMDLNRLNNLCMDLELMLEFA
jgi:hypothetical protein